MSKVSRSVLPFTPSPVERPLVDSVLLLGVRVDCLERTLLTRSLLEFYREGKRGWISYLNVHAINLAQKNEKLCAYLNKSLLTYCDGQGLRLGASMLGKNIPMRIVMSDWIYDVSLLCESNNLRLYLLGSTDSVRRKTVVALQALFPQLQIVGSHHGYFAHAKSDDVVRDINASRPDVLIVGMGMPLQEEWIENHFANLNVNIILNAGSCFDFVSGEKRRCPQWMGTIGLEWMHRLFQEPRRLWRRYLLGNPLFLWRVLRIGWNETIKRGSRA